MEFRNALCIFLFLQCFIIIILSIASTNPKKPPKNLPPGPAPWPIFGNLFQFKKNPHQSLAKLTALYGPMITIKLGQLTTIVISSSELAKQVFLFNDIPLAGRTIPDSVHALQHHKSSIFFLPISPLWKIYRRIYISKVFTPKRLDATAELRRQKVEDLLHFVKECARDGLSINIGDAVLLTTMNLMSSTVFSVDFGKLGTQKAKEYREILEGIIDAMGKPNIVNYFPVLGKLDPHGQRRRLAGFMTKMFKIIEEFMNQRLKSRKEMGDVLDAIMDFIAAEKMTGSIKTYHIKHLIVDLFIAAMDTSSITLEWAMAELMRNPSIKKKLREEIWQTIGKEQPIRESDISKLPYLQAVVKETFRLHPAAPFLLPRKALEDVHINGYTIPKHAQVWINAWAIGRDSSHWKDPHEFCPERFLVLSDIDVKGRDFELIPFGAGRRICPGLPLALRMVHLVLGSLIQCFDWKVEEGKDVDMEEDFRISLHKLQSLHAIPVLI